MADYLRHSERDAPVVGLPATVKRARTDLGANPPREEGHFEDGRAPWRQADPPVVYGPPGLPNAEPIPAGGPGMGFSAPMSGVLGSLAPSLIDIPGSNTVLGTALGLNIERPDYVVRQVPPFFFQGVPSFLPPDASPTLFVEGLPNDCTLREASHVFRPFVGFKEVRLVNREPKRPGGEKLLLCFVDFVDAKCAAIALEALQGYKFDEKTRESSSLKLQFARFSGPRGAPRDNYRGGRDRDDVYHVQGIRR
eukprot:c26139_g2_i1 orf=211-963(+)